MQMIENKQQRPMLIATILGLSRGYESCSRVSAGHLEFTQRPQQIQRLRQSQSQTKEYSRQGLHAGASGLFGDNPLPVSAGQSAGSRLNIQTGASRPIGLQNVTLLASDDAVSNQLNLALKVADFSVNVTPGSATGLSGAVANLSWGGVEIAGKSTISNVEKGAALITFGNPQRLQLRFQ